MESQKQQDRRIRRTQKLLKESLISLMQENEFKNISVKDVTTRADLNRGTFYLHYSDIYQLLQEMEEELLMDFQKMIDGHDHAGYRSSLLDIIVPMLDYIEKNKPICKIMFENNPSNEFLSRFHSLMHENGAPIIQKLFPSADEKCYDMFIEFVTYGTIGTIRRWVNSGQDMPKDVMADKLDKAILGVAERLLR